MALIQWNLRGFRKNREQVQLLVSEHIVSAVCLQETKLGDFTPNFGQNFNLYRSSPMIGEHACGGTAIIVKKSVNQRIIQIDGILQANAVQIFTNKWVTLCSVYLEPNLEERLLDMSGRPRQLHVGDLQDLVDQLPQPFILMGDFNAKHTLWGERSCNHRGYVIEELIDRNDVILMNNGSPTRYDVVHNSASAIDLTICSSSLRLDYQWSVDDCLHGSDHWPIHIKYVRNLPSHCLPKWKIGAANWKLYSKSSLVKRNHREFSSNCAAYDYLVDIMLCGAMGAIPKTTGKPRRPVVPWWNDKCAVSRRIARACYKRYRRRPILVNKIAYSRNLAIQSKVFKEARRESFIRYISDLKYNSPMSIVWDRIRKLQGKFSPSPSPILKINLSVISDARQVAETLARHFADVSSSSHYSPEFQNIRNSTSIVPPVCSNSDAYNLPFSMTEFEYAVSQSSPTSPGEDEIMYAMISHLPQTSKKFLLCVLNEFWCSGSSHRSWEVSVIIPVLKPNKDSSLPKNYRPIALTSCVCKLYERMVNNRLVWYLESRNLLSNRQFGFRKNRSTIDPLLILTREIQNAFANQNQTIAVFFDLEKAYDTTWRGGILMQLADWEIGGNMFNVVKDFLSDRYLKVRIGSEFSSEYIQEEGIPQGSVLSPTLFNIAINGLLEQVPVGVVGLAFADDYAITCSKSTAVEACQKIQEAINAATTWAKSRGFKFSAEKTKAIRFSRTRKREVIPTLFLEGTMLLYEEHVKYLGVFLDKKLTFAHHIHELVVDVKHRFNILKVVSSLNWGADRTTLLRLYHALCLSKIDYACQIYGSACKTLLGKLDIVHNMALRICTGAFKTSPVESLYVDSGFAPLSIRREELNLRYLSRTLTCKQNPNYKYIKHPRDRAPTKPKLPKPLEVRMADSAREIKLLPSFVEERCPSKFPPWCRPAVSICEKKFSKKSLNDFQLRNEFYAHCNQHADSVAIFTDGSKSEEGVGSAVIVGDHILKRRLPSECSIFTAELFAVFFALKYIFNSSKQGDRFVIYIDSFSVLNSLKRLFPDSVLVQELQDWLVLLHSRKKVTVEFCWVPSHVGVGGNERADIAAKSASRLTHISPVNIPHSDFNTIIRFYMRQRWQDRWTSAVGNLKLKAIRPSVHHWTSPQMDRRASIVLTRLRIGHTYLTHKYLMASGAERQSPRCSACNVDITVKHFLIDCPLYHRKRLINNLCNKSILEILGEDSPVERVFKFLKEINLFYDI